MLEKHDFYYPPNDAPRTLHIWLPDGYHLSDERYPVTYFFDGHNLFDDAEATYGTSWGLANFLGSWEKPLIVVGLECSHVGDQRLDEYCPYDAQLFGKRIHGLGSQTLSWMVDEVKPWVDATYRTWPHREATAIAGSSMGGLMSTYGVIVRNDVFGKAACLSTGNRYHNRRILPVLEGAQLSPDTRVYLSWGEHEAGRTWGQKRPLFDSAEARATWKLSHALEDKGAKTCVWCEVGGEHNEATWRAQDGRFMDFLWLDRIPLP